jgi:hypothetical protein
LYYQGRNEFIETVRAIEHNRWLAGTLGKNGRQFFKDHYDWPVIEGKYLDMLGRVSGSAAPRVPDPLPGWFERRKAECPPAAQVLAQLPSGASVAPELTLSRPMTAPPLPARPLQQQERPTPAPSPTRRGPHRPRRSNGRSAGGRR